MWNPFAKRKRGGQIRFLQVPAIGDTSSDPEKIAARLSQAMKDAQEAAPAYDSGKFMDESRKTIAYWFVVAFIIIITLILVSVPIYNAIVFHGARVIVEELTYQPLDVEKILATVGTLLGTPLGFVVGYYFKEEHATRGGSIQK